MEWLLLYRAETPGIEALVNPTIILGPEDEPEPDACLVVFPEFGGKTRTERGVIAGSPELVVEVASSSLARDLDVKRRRYELNAVGEYLVIAVTAPQIFWFARQDQALAQLAPGPDGIYRSQVFPGLWLDPDALLRLDRNRVVEILRQGLASTEHAEFVKRLAETAGPSGTTR
jgi:Uma2 family endonuclease